MQMFGQELGRLSRYGKWDYFSAYYSLPRSGLLEPLRIDTTRRVVSIRCSRSPAREVAGVQIDMGNASSGTAEARHAEVARPDGAVTKRLDQTRSESIPGSTNGIARPGH